MSIFNPDDYNNSNSSGTLNTTELNKLYLQKTGNATSTAITSFLSDTNLSNVNLSGTITADSHYITPAELSCLDNVSSNIQQQINSIMAGAGSNLLSTNNSWTGINTYNNQINLNGNIISNTKTITPTELSYLDNLNSNIQTQLDNKLNFITSPSNNNICSMNSLGQVINNNLALTIDPSLSINSNTLIPSSQAIKLYVDNSISNIPAQVVGQSITYYFTNINSGINTYELIQPYPDTSGQDIEYKDVQNNKLLIGGYITNGLNRNKINAGIFSFTLYASVDDATSLSNIQIEIYKRDTLGNETLILNGISTNDINTIYPSVIPYNCYGTLTTDITTNLTDEMVIKVYAYTSVSNKLIRVYWYHGGNTNSYFTTPLIYNHNDLSNLQGGSNNERYHLTLSQYNNATNNSSISQTGLLLNTDWNTFNNKQNQINNTTDLIAKSLTLYNYGDVQTKINLKQDIINSTTDITAKSLTITEGNIITLLNNKQNQILLTTDISLNKLAANFFYTIGNTTDLQTQINNLASSSQLLSGNNTWTGVNNFTSNNTYLGNIVVNSSTISPLELSYLDNVSSNIQSQINNKLDISNNSTVNGLTITKENISYLNGSTSNIQTQINSKQPTITNLTDLTLNSISTINGNVDTNLSNKQPLINSSSNLTCNKISTTISGDLDDKIATKNNLITSATNLLCNKLIIATGDIDTQINGLQTKINTSTNLSLNNLAVNGTLQLGTQITNLESYLSTLSSNIYKYNKVLYVSKLGNDTNGDGSLNNPFLTLGKAITNININTGIFIIIFPGVYSENVDFSSCNNITISAITFDNRSIVQIAGILTFGSSYSSSLNNMTCNAIVHSGSGSLYLNYVNITNSSTCLTSSGASYLRCSNIIMPFDGQVYFGSGGSGQKVFINNCQLGSFSIGASVIIKIDGCELVSYIDLNKSGAVCGINNTPIYYPNYVPAITQASGSYLYLTNLSILDLSNNPTFVTLANGSYHSFENVVFKRIGSTLSGNYISNRISYNDYLSVDNLIVGDTSTSTTINKNELSYLSGVTSNIQTQLNNKQTIRACYVGSPVVFNINDPSTYVQVDNMRVGLKTASTSGTLQLQAVYANIGTSGGVFEVTRGNTGTASSNNYFQMNTTGKTDIYGLDGTDGTGHHFLFIDATNKHFYKCTTLNNNTLGNIAISLERLH